MLRPLFHAGSDTLYNKDWTEAPQSPLTDSTVSSQESSVAELIESSAGRSFLGLGLHHQGSSQPHGAFPYASPAGVFNGHSAFGLALPSSPELSLAAQAMNSKCNPKHFRPSGPARGSHPAERQQNSRGRRSQYRNLFEQVTRINSGQRLEDSLGGQEVVVTVEHLIAVIKSMPADEEVVPALAGGLQYMDSRAVAFLLKDVSKAGLAYRALEVFQWLRSLPPSHNLSKLCDVFTYTTVIALCGQSQSLGLALELIGEMRGRGIPRNVHTYSALMNTCIKNGELELALDVFSQLQVEGCAANVVTYNTLVDIYGKLGRWQDAIQVISEVYVRGLKPDVRTFNTAIIAANMCNQPLEALKVYDRLISAGYEPTATTYTALISSYGKAGRLDEALEVFDKMVRTNCERNVITYASLIAVSERAGRWQLALELFDRMQRERVTPNTVTFNSVMNACSQGGQSERGEKVLQMMLSKQCKPNTSTYAALMMAHIRAGHWRAALQVWHRMHSGTSSQTDPALFASLIKCLWDSGVPAAQAKAARLFSSSSRPSGLQLTQEPGQPLEVTISSPNSAMAVLSLRAWLVEAGEKLACQGKGWLGPSVIIKATAASAEAGTEAQAAVVAVLQGLSSPFCVAGSGASLRLTAEANEVAAWLLSPETADGVAAILPPPSSDLQSGREALGTNVAAQEAGLIARCASANSLLTQVEVQQEARRIAAEACYCGAREECLGLAKQLAAACALPSEAIYSAMVLLDQCLTAGMRFPRGSPSMLVAACLLLAARQCGPSAGQQSASQQAEALQMKLMELNLMTHGSILSVLEEMTAFGLPIDTNIVTPLSVLNRYLAYLAQDLPDQPTADLPGTPRTRSRISGASRELAGLAMLHPHAQHIRPSLLAAAAIALDRKCRGMVPHWPAALPAWTGILGPLTPDFDTAVKAVMVAARRSETTSPRTPRSAPALRRP